ncbi:MAG: hypothetical protein NUV67_06115 [archaeon]|nr:hypothetical protein [archaeon]
MPINIIHKTIRGHLNTRRAQGHAQATLNRIMAMSIPPEKKMLAIKFFLDHIRDKKWAMTLGHMRLDPRFVDLPATRKIVYGNPKPRKAKSKLMDEIRSYLPLDHDYNNMDAGQIRALGGKVISYVNRHEKETGELPTIEKIVQKFPDFGKAMAEKKREEQERRLGLNIIRFGGKSG